MDGAADGWCNGTCGKHEGSMTKIGAYTMLVRVVGGTLAVIGLALVAVAFSGYREIQTHKIEALQRYSDVQMQMSDLTGAVNITNNNFSHIRDDVKDIKEALGIRKTTLAETAEVQTSTLWSLQ